MLDLLGLLNLQGNLFRNVGEKILKEISLENVEVEHDFFEGLSTSVISKFARPLSNLTRIGSPYDFATASKGTRSGVFGSLNLFIFNFQRV